MKVEIAPPVRARLRKALLQAGQTEIGGVLMGEQIAPGRFRIIDISIDGRTGGRAQFVRNHEEHAKALDVFFERTGNDYTRYNNLGEWHSHPGFAISPSGIDCDSMLALVRGEREIDFAVLMIVRLYWWWVLKYSCTLFHRGAEAISVDVVESTAC